MRFRLQRVEYMPKTLEPGVLYVSEAFGTAAHLCACGCGSKIRTPLGPTEWHVEVAKRGPSLYPSVGNWQKPCQSHYWIREGDVRWAAKWTSEEIAAGRRHEEERRQAYYDSGRPAPGNILARFWCWLKRLVAR